MKRSLTDIESDRVERKESLTSADRIREAICAFANDLPGNNRPGVVFIGVRNDGGCANLTVTDRLLLTLSQMKDDGNILPIPSLVVRKTTLSGCEVAVVLVHPSDAPPIRFRGVVWIRVGPRRGIATSEEERRLSEKRRFMDLPFELRPVRDAMVEDLDLDFFQRNYLPSSVTPEVLAQNNRTVEQQLTSLRFATTDAPPLLTVLGLLTIGRDPQEFLGGAYIQFLRIDGIELGDPIRDAKRIAGPIAEILRRVDEILEAHIAVRVEITSGPVERRRPDYPLASLQQVVRNAVMHRNYEGTNAPVRINWFSDRIEIWSPGGPYGQVTRENFGQANVTDYRNLHLAEVMYRLGYVQRFGFGIAIARLEMEKNGNPPPEFVATDTHVQVTLRRSP